MEEIYYIYATAGLAVLYFIHQVVSRKFDPFAPVWLFLIGYLQVYVLQASAFTSGLSKSAARTWLAAANFRSFWALLWFLLVYQLGPARIAARILPSPPQNWSPLLAGYGQPPAHYLGAFLRNMFVSGDAPTLEAYSQRGGARFDRSHS